MITAANFLLLIIDSPEFAVQNTLIWITETGVAVLFVFEAVVLYRKRKAERYTAADIQE